MVALASPDNAEARPLTSSSSLPPSVSCLNKNATVATEIPLRYTDLEEGPDDDYYESATLAERRTHSTWQRLLMLLRRKIGAAPRLNDATSKSLLGKEGKPQKARGFSICGRLCIALPILILCMLGIVHILDTVLGLGSSIWDYEHDDFMPDWGQPGHSGEGLANYPTDFTRDVIPIPCHSHNDYWRRVPLYQAIHYGCTGVEADVWLFPGQEDDLFVGHNTASLTPNRTFLSLYVNPLATILDKQNPHTQFANASRHGVFDEDPEQTVVLLVDFKTDGPSLLPVVQAQLEPLRSKGYLTYYDGTIDKTIPGPITVVATGNAPFDLLIANSTYRDIFFDAPLSKMSDLASSSDDDDSRFSTYIPGSPEPTSSKHINRGQGSTGTSLTTALSFNSTNSFYASTDFGAAIGHIWGGRLSNHQIKLLRKQIKGAKKQGLKSRYWGTPSWPIGLRNQVWEVLVREGASYLNVDDLRSAARRDWGQRRRGGGRGRGPRRGGRDW